MSSTIIADGNSNSIQNQIKNDIFNGYDKFVRPVQNSSDVINVRLDPGLYSLISVVRFCSLYWKLTTRIPVSVPI